MLTLPLGYWSQWGRASKLFFISAWITDGRPMLFLTLNVIVVVILIAFIVAVFDISIISIIVIIKPSSSIPCSSGVTVP
jgi:hypothetical protein